MAEFRCRTCGRKVICERLEDAPTLPFCSERCRLLDLGKWFDGEHVIPGEPLPDDEEEPEN